MRGKAVVEATFASVNTLFCQHVASYTGSNSTLRGTDATGAWTLPELQDLLDEWLLDRFTDRCTVRTCSDLRLFIDYMSSTEGAGMLPDLFRHVAGGLPFASTRG